jgi:hypothetical protein
VDQDTKKPELGKDLPQVVPGPAEEHVLRVSGHVFEEVPAEEIEIRRRVRPRRIKGEALGRLDPMAEVEDANG